MPEKKKSYGELLETTSNNQELITMFVNTSLSNSGLAYQQPRFTTIDRPQYFAAIDLGSNTCRLIITKKFEDQFTTLEISSKIVRLSEGLSLTGRLSEVAMQRTINVIAHFERKISQYTNIQVMAVATEACRKATNASLFLERLWRRTRIRFKVISSSEESYFVAKSCAPLMCDSKPYGVFIDIGGGSTEVIWAKNRGDQLEIIDSISLPFGVVNVSETKNTKKATHYQEIQKQISDKLVRFSERNNITERINENLVQMIGTSGTTTTLSAIHQNLRTYDRCKIDRSMLTFDNILRTTKSLQLMSTQELVIHPCIGQERSELILAGTAILGGICAVIPVGSLQVADRGVRDGIVSHMAYGERTAPDHRQSLPQAIFIA